MRVRNRDDALAIEGVFLLQPIRRPAV